MITIKPGSGRRGGAPLAGSAVPLLMMGHGGDQRRELGHADGQQGAGIGVVLQHRQVGRADVPGQRDHRHQLPHQVLDPGLVLAGRLGQPPAGPHPPLHDAVGVLQLVFASVAGALVALIVAYRRQKIAEADPWAPSVQ
jgi:hypothetical protein